MSNARPLILVLSIAVFGLLIPIVHAAESFGTTDLASQVADAKRDGNWRRAGDIVLAAFGDDGLGGLDDAAALALYETGSATLSALDDASGSLALDEMALAEFANREFEEGIRRATLNLASSYFWGDELEQARALAGQLMASSPRDAGDNDIYVGAASVRAHIDRTDKNYDECIALLQPVVDAPDAFPGVDPNTWFIVHRGLSLCYRYQGVANDYDMAALERAARYAEAAVRYAQRDPEPTATSLSIALESLARVQWELGRQDDAIRNQQQAAGLLESQGLDTGRDYSIIASLLSIYLARNDRFDEALEYARRGTAAGRQHYLRAFFGPGKPTANDTIYIAYAANAFFEALKAREDSGEPATPEELDAVFDYAQFSATTEIGQSLKITAAQASSRSAALRAYRDARKKMQNRWLELSTEIGYLASDSTAFAETLAARTEEKQRLTRRLTTQQARASADVSSYLGLWGTDSVSIAALQDVLAADELLLHISSIYSYVTVIAITRDDVHWYRPAFENDEFCELARRHRASLSATTDLDCEDRIVAITPTFRELQPFDFAANATLYGRLFAPAVEALGDKPKWIVSANGLASTLALPALLRQPVSEAELASRGFADLPWLGRETALFLAPRMSALVAWRSGVRDEPNDDRASRLVAVAGAPCIGRFTGAACARQAVALDDESVVFQNPEGPVLRRGKSDDLSFESLSRLPELPAAMTELRRIANE